MTGRRMWCSCAIEGKYALAEILIYYTGHVLGPYRYDSFHLVFTSVSLDSGLLHCSLLLTLRRRTNQAAAQFTFYRLLFPPT